MLEQDARGFTLIEMMVVLVIIGILLVIAVPMYSSYRIKSNRSEGKVALVDAAQQMERYFTDNNTYVGASAGTTFPSTSENSLYQVSIVGSPTASGYTLQAVAQGSQAGDTGCTTLKLDQTGKKTPGSCW